MLTRGVNVMSKTNTPITAAQVRAMEKSVRRVTRLRYFPAELSITMNVVNQLEQLLRVSLRIELGFKPGTRFSSGCVQVEKLQDGFIESLGRFGRIRALISDSASLKNAFSG